MKTPRKGGWPWKFICRLPGWIVEIRMAVLKRREQTEDVGGEIADYEQRLSNMAFSELTEAIYIDIFKEPYPKEKMPILITDKTIVISKKEMDISYKAYRKRLKGIYKDINLY